jgi:hypothetical protein
MGVGAEGAWRMNEGRVVHWVATRHVADSAPASSCAAHVDVTPSSWRFAGPVLFLRRSWW